ncbi:uncharacterized protein CHSO_2677 [Chryseobacterium sp. StRB126]|uniref:hypothetical protein n=1 Tax=Chryseobacterium sp. StRB126 TaxID=878220 RepID=UPI0004E9966B|nr:hypothetical protein [Chryseobacterium sp. StRB126]BAP31714.1 uncharacterized protein CHSO_2677 [Chryseobacterium sp. StRB126]
MDKNTSPAYDLDLFFTNSLWGKIHLATAGGYICDEIFNDSQHGETKINLRKSARTDYGYKINPNLDKILRLGDREIDFKKFDKEMYLKDFIFYAKKGYFSFDKTFVNSPLDFHYHLVAYPIFSENNFQDGLSDYKKQEKEEIIRKAFLEPIEMNMLK